MKKMHNTTNFFTLMKKFLLESQIGFYTASKKAVIEFQSREDGKIHKKPIQYIRSGNRLVALCNRSVEWWKNLKFGAPVDVIIKGEKVSAWAEAFDDPESVKKVWNRIRVQLKETIDRVIRSDPETPGNFGFNESHTQELVLVTINIP